MSTLAMLLLATQAATPATLTANVCASTTVVEPGQRATRGEPTFSARDTLDLELQTRVRPNLKGDHLLRLKLYTPRGYLYQTITVPFRFAAPSPDSREERPATRAVPGYPRPLEVQTLGATTGARGATRSRSASAEGREPPAAAPDLGPTRRRPRVSLDAATARLPVAGTSITLGSLFGRWTVVPYLDDQAAPCGPPRTFEIRQ